jgi:hypothetical protein
MFIEVTSKDKDGNILFNGKLSKAEASLVLGVGINYLLHEGVLPLFTGKDEAEGAPIIAKEPETKQ